jgi:hypothetical protein
MYYSSGTLKQQYYYLFILTANGLLSNFTQFKFLNLYDEF